MSSGTGEARTELWSDSLQLFRESPIFGIGHRGYGDVNMQVAHNSFVHSTTELGFFGGMFFLGVFAISAITFWQLSKKRHDIVDPTLQQLLPFICALLAAYGTSLLSLSRCYAVPTYLIAGLAASYLRLLPPVSTFQLPVFDVRLFQRLAMGQVAMIAAVYIFVRIAIRL